VSGIPADQLARHITDWLRARADDAGALGAVVGISGGVDSATVAALCLRAFPQTTLGVLMPCHSDPRDLEDARIVCAALGLASTTVVLDAAHDALVDALRGSAHFAEHRLALANLRPRLRMTSLYYFANRLNRLVAGTGNRSEAYVGYFTKYGDGGVDVLPIGGLLKSEVRALAGDLGVPERVITKPPTAGLWVGQTDEAEMGFTYDMLERYLTKGARDVPADVTARIEQLRMASHHKRELPPIAPI